MTISLRPATPDDAAALADLVNIAGDGMPESLWARQTEPGQSPLEVGRLRTASDTGPFSWTKATLAEVDGRPAGMVMTHLVPDAPESFDEGTHPIYRPLIVLENRVPGTRFIEALATYPDFRRGGVAQRLIGAAEAEPGPEGMAIITTDTNATAQAFYGQRGYVAQGSVPLIRADWRTSSREWLLMRKPR